MKASEALVRMLKEAGVEVIFGLCGDTSLPLYEALHDVGQGLTHVLARDERSASYMADVYARLSGRVGVCEGPSGGGALYILPGLAEANASSVPLVAFTTDIELRNYERGTLTELDQSTLMRPVTRWSRTPASAADLPRTVREAFRRATAGAMGAVHVRLPEDLLEDELPDDIASADGICDRYPRQRPAPDPEAVKQAASILVEAQAPVIVAGAGVLRSQAWDELRELAELLGAPVATSVSGKGAIAETHPLSLGVVGSNGGLPYRRRFIDQADAVLLVGTRGGSVTTQKWTAPRQGRARLIQVDVSPEHLGLNYALDAALLADAKLGLAALLEELDRRLGGRSAGKVDPDRMARERQAYLERIEEFGSDAVPIRPERFIAELEHVMAPRSVLVVDPGTATPYMAAYYRLPQPGRWWACPRAHGALGYSLPGVVGAYLAVPGAARVVGIMGDGSFGISAGELETIVRLGLPVTLIVLNNASYGWIKAGQKERGGKYYSVDLLDVDHAAVARAYGLKGWRVEHPRDLAPALKAALEASGPALVDVVVQQLQDARAPVAAWVV
mgnify:CR=1 FL=1